MTVPRARKPRPPVVVRPWFVSQDSSPPLPGLSPQAVDDLLDGMVVRVIEALVRRPDLVKRLRTVVSGDATAEPLAMPPRFLSVMEYARHARVSERTVRYLIKEMAEHVHFHRDGRHGRRVIIHVTEADVWRAARVRPSSGEDIDRLAIDEVTRRRARVALRQAGKAR